MKTKVCSRCGIEKPVSEFFARKERKSGKGLRSKCKECESEIRKAKYATNREREIERSRKWQRDNPEKHIAYRDAYNHSPAGKERDKRYKNSKHGKAKIREYRRSDARKETIRRWNEDNIEKKRAIWHVWNAVKTGKLVKPEACSKCGRTDTIIHAHHHNGYEPEHRLDVIWLCPKCHKAEHHKLEPMQG